MTHPGSKFTLLRASFTLLVVSSLLLIPNLPFMSWRVAATDVLQKRTGNPEPGKPQATIANLDKVRAEKPGVPEVPMPIRSTIP